MFKISIMKCQRIQFLVLISFFVSCSVWAQTNNQARTPEEMIYIPGVYRLIDSAMLHSPLLRTKDIEIEIKKLEWRAQRWEWTDFIQPFAEYRFGTVDNVVISPTGVPLDIQQSQAHRFNVGGRINLTIFNAINWREKMKQYESSIDLDSARRKEIESALAQEVIRLWNMAVTYRNILFLKSEHKATQESNLKEAQLKYETGEVPIMELARITEIATKAQEEYELARKELIEAVFLLSELVGRQEITSWERR
jgi:outer membrane protein TolC